MKRVLIAGIGNVLLSDDGAGPYVVRNLAARYSFEHCAEVLDLGTPTLELVDYLFDRDLVIFVDSVKMKEPVGTIRLFRNEELQACPSPHGEGPHAPSLIQSIHIARLLGVVPQRVVLIGIVGNNFDIGCGLSEVLIKAVDPAIQAILCELSSAGCDFAEKAQSEAPSTWWIRTTLPVENVVAAET
jgi:hydrogenase maturation protease